MTSSMLQELNDPRTRLYPLNVDQYHSMIEAGILSSGDPYELLNGQLVLKDRSKAGEDPMTVGLEHALIVKRLQKLSAKLERMGAHMQIQQPITLPPHHEPEPDGAVIIGTPEDFSDHHPGPGDVACVIEVADASLRRDRTTKLHAYAKAGLEPYYVINLLDRVVERYTDPNRRKGEYRAMAPLSGQQAVVVPAKGGKTLTVSAKHLLP